MNDFVRIQNGFVAIGMLYNFFLLSQNMLPIYGKVPNIDKTHFGIFPVPVIHDDDPNNSRVARRLAWDGSRNSSSLAQLLGSGKGIHGYGSSGEESLSRSI